MNPQSILLCLLIPAMALGEEGAPAAYGEPVNIDELLPNEPGGVGYTLAPAELEHELETALSVAMALPPALHAYVELSAEADLPDLEPRVAIGPALRWSVTPEFAVSAGALAGVTRAASPVRFILEAQQEF